MQSDDKKDEGAPEIITEDDLTSVTGGLHQQRTLANMVGGNDTIFATATNDTLRVDPGDDSFNIGMPPSKK